MIFKTFRETRRAAETAQATVKSFKDAERGFLHLGASSLTGHNEEDHLTLVVRFRNVGRAKVFVKSVLYKLGPERENLNEEIQTEPKSWMEVDEYNPVFLEIPRSFADKLDPIFIQGHLVFRDQFHDEHHETFFVRAYGRTQENEGWTGVDIRYKTSFLD